MERCEVISKIVSICRKAEPFCKKPNSGYHQYSRVDVRTRESSVDNFVRDIMMDNHLDNESDNEDDPTKLLDQWLGELNTLKKVRYFLRPEPVNNDIVCRVLVRE